MSGSRAPMEAVTALDHARGSAAPAITIVEYGDYDCPHTRAAQAEVDRLMKENPDVRVVFRNFPLRHLHVNAEVLSRLAEAAALQGRFWEMHDHLMHHRRGVTQADVMKDAADCGVDMERASRDIESESIAREVERDVQSGKASGVHSTPSFFFEGVLFDGHYDYGTLEGKLAEARRTKSGG